MKAVNILALFMMIRNKGLPKENKRTEEVVKSKISTISSEGNENQPDVADVFSPVTDSVSAISRAVQLPYSFRLKYRQATSRRDSLYGTWMITETAPDMRVLMQTVN